MKFKKITKLIAPNANQQLNVFGIFIDNVSMNEAVDWVIENAHGKRQVIAQFVNADCLNKAYTNKDYHRLLNKAQRVFADGSGISFASKLKQQPIRENVNGTDMFPLICEKAQRSGTKIFLLGAAINIAKQTKKNIQRYYPAANIVGTQNGYFDKKDTQAVIKKINSSNTDILLVAMGAPLQEQWIDQYKNSINAKVCIGVGGLFDFYSGRISRSPQWLRKIGCEWVWRLIQEPKRMWKRYLIGNFIFVTRVFIEAVTNTVTKTIGGNYANR